MGGMRGYERRRFCGLMSRWMMLSLKRASRAIAIYINRKCMYSVKIDKDSKLFSPVILTGVSDQVSNGAF